MCFTERLSAFSIAGEDGDKVCQRVSEHARRESLPRDAFDLPRWVPDHAGYCDLNDPYDNHFAFAKAQASLSGDYYWPAQYGWIVICPPDEPAYSFLGRLTGGWIRRFQRGVTVTATLIVSASRSKVAFTVSPGARVLR